MYEHTGNDRTDTVAASSSPPTVPAPLATPPGTAEPAAPGPASAAGASSAPTPGPRQTRVAAALGQLPRLDQTPLSGHPDLYQQIHGELQGALAEIDHA